MVFVTHGGFMKSALAETRLGCIGVGNIGEAIISGLLKEGQMKSSQIKGTTRSDQSMVRVRQNLGIEVSIGNQKLARECDVIVLAVKWDAIDIVLKEIADEITENKLIISLAGAMTTSFIEQRLNGKVPVVLAIPNSPCAVNNGLTLVLGGAYAAEEDLSTVESIFSCLGATVRVDRNTLDTFIALASSGPAFFYLIVEAIATAGTNLGLSESAARRATAQAMKGAAEMLLVSDQDPAWLREKITTPGGCTIAGLNELERQNIRGVLADAIQSTVERLGELRQAMGTI
jgi:pyrroline-5-carboxylate reductase